MIALGLNHQNLRSATTRILHFYVIAAGLEMIGALNYFFVIFVLPLLVLFALPFMFYTPLLFISLVYLIWLWFDWKSPKKGGYPSRFLQRLPIHRWLCNYFPITLHQTADLPDDHNYLIGVHPHGIVCVSAFVFSGNGTGILDRFPNLKFHLCALNPNFWFPLRREWLLLHGVISCAKESILHVLNRKRKGQAAVLVVGGAEESMDAHPGKYILTLKNRKGFVKVALESGAHLVPCFAFGENEVYRQVSNEEGTLIRRFQSSFKGMFGFAPVIFYGKWMFNYSFGPLPHRVPLNTVLGAPIPVQKTPSPTQQQVDDLHALYIERLTEIFERNKERFGVSKDYRLIIC